MHQMTIRNVDPVVKAAPEERARTVVISQSEAPAGHWRAASASGSHDAISRDWAARCRTHQRWTPPLLPTPISIP